MLVDESSNLYIASGDSIEKFTTEGNSVWENTRTRSYLSVALSHDYKTLYVVECDPNTDDCYFTAFSTDNGEELTDRFSIGAKSFTLPVSDAEGNVFVTAASKIYAFNLEENSLLLWEKLNSEIDAVLPGQFGTPLVYGENIYVAKKYQNISHLAVMDKNTGELLNYLRLDSGPLRRVSDNLVLVEDMLAVPYIGPNCGASKEDGYATFDISALQDMEGSATPSQRVKFGCSGQIINLQGSRHGEKAYVVPTDFPFRPWTTLYMIFKDGDIVEREYIFSLGVDSTPSGKIFVSHSKNAYIFSLQEEHSTVYGFNSEINFEYFSEDEIKNIAVGDGILYILTPNLLKAVGL